jgi:hypothetical protein
MNAIVLPEDLQAWAEGEVSAGRAASVDEVAATAMTNYRRHWDELRQSLIDAEVEANEKGWLELDDVFDEIYAKLDAREAFEAEWALKKSKRA